MTRFFRELSELLKAGRDVVLATVVGHAGSTPRETGSRMIVLATGAVIGSVGGGMLEADVMRRAASLFGRGGAMLHDFRLVTETARTLGMTCGGDVRVLIEHVCADTASQTLFAALADDLDQGRVCLLVSEFDGPPGDLRPLTKRLAAPGEAALLAPGRSERPGLVETGGILRLIEPLQPASVLHLAGAGHVGLATAKIAAMAGFSVRVMDDRAEFADPARFPEARSVRVVPGFEACFPFGLGPADFVIIVTRGHVHDKSVLAQALALSPGYVGMIGSRKKKAAVYAALEREGVSPDALARVHCPIGLPIGAQTPEEIAVSIVAELIQVRAGTVS